MREFLWKETEFDSKYLIRTGTMGTKTSNLGDGNGTGNWYTLQWDWEENGNHKSIPADL